MPHVVDQATCIGCSSCVGVCPVTAISMEDAKANIDPAICIDCTACAGVCPVTCITQQ